MVKWVTIKEHTMNKKMLCGKRFECKFFEDLDDWAIKKHKLLRLW